MACSCSSAGFTSFAGAAPSTPSSSSSSSASTSLSFLHHQYRLPGSMRALLRLDCEKTTTQRLYFSAAAKQGQGQYDKAKKTTQKGGGRSAGAAVKEERASWKGGGTGGKNPKSYNKNPNPKSFESSNSRSYSSSRSVSTLQNKDENEDRDGRRRNPGSSSRNSRPSTTDRGNQSKRVFSDEEEDDEDEDEEGGGFTSDDEGGYSGLPIMPIPPAGFVLAEDGSVSIMAPPQKRVTTLVDQETKMSLDCLIRRVFSSSDGRQCFLLCPLDTPVQILRVDDGEVLKEISDEELEDVFATASYELAKRRLHLIQSGYCLTLRGGFCFSDDEVIDLDTVYGESGEGDRSLNEGVEVASFIWNDSEYLIFTPFDPLMFVSYKDNKTGELLIADDDLLEDEAVLDAIDEEKEFQAYMEEDSLMVEEDEEEE